MQYKEIEVRFLEINKAQVVEKLRSLGAEDRGEHMLSEVIIYDKEYLWRDKERKHIRLRTYAGKTYLSYKHHKDLSLEGTDEVEFEVSDPIAAEEFFVRLGYVPYRHQEKRRHTLVLDECVIDIDEWPRIPVYLEIEGASEVSIKQCAEKIGLDWSSVELRTPRQVIEEKYRIPVGLMRWFTFDRFE